jgi:predicted transcriptional regulator
MKELNYKIFRQQLKFYRRKAGMTQDDLAEKVGISKRWLSQIETTDSVPSFETLLKICSVLKVPVKYLFTDDIVFDQKQLDKLKDMSPEDIDKIFNMLSGLNKI